MTKALNTKINATKKHCVPDLIYLDIFVKNKRIISELVYLRKVDFFMCVSKECMLI